MIIPGNDVDNNSTTPKVGHNSYFTGEVNISRSSLVPRPFNGEEATLGAIVLLGCRVCPHSPLGGMVGTLKNY